MIYRATWPRPRHSAISTYIVTFLAVITLLSCGVTADPTLECTTVTADECQIIDVVHTVCHPYSLMLLLTFSLLNTHPLPFTFITLSNH